MENICIIKTTKLEQFLRSAAAKNAFIEKIQQRIDFYGNERKQKMFSCLLLRKQFDS